MGALLKSRLFPPLMKHCVSYKVITCSLMANTELGPGHLINWLLCSPPPLDPADNFSNKQNKKLLNSNNKQTFLPRLYRKEWRLRGMRITRLLTSGWQVGWGVKRRAGGKHKNQNRIIVTLTTSGPSVMTRIILMSGETQARDCYEGRGAGPQGYTLKAANQARHMV